MADHDDAHGADARLAYLQHRISKSYENVKADKLAKAFVDEEGLEKIKEFLDTPDCRVLACYGDALTMSLGLPKKVPRGTKVVTMIKPRACKVSTTTPAKDIVVAEMGSEPLETLERLLSEVYLPLLSNPSNTTGWGDGAVKGVIEQLHSVLANVSITVGQSRGETCLPLPPLDPATAARMSSKDRIQLLEGAVITWTKQIKGILSSEVESEAKASAAAVSNSGGSGAQPVLLTADGELLFWKTKAANLNAVYAQLQSERIRRVLQYLDTSRSTYCGPFAKLCREVFVARIEANDNVKFLRTLEAPLAKLGSAGDDFDRLPELYRPLLHTLLLIWKHSGYYNTPRRLTGIVSAICNGVIAAAQRFTSGKALWDLLNEEGGTGGLVAISKMKTILRGATELKRVFNAYKAIAGVECPSNPWRVQSDAMFSRLDAFLQRAHDVLEIAAAVVQFGKLEKVVIGGTKGRMLTSVVNSVYADFRAATAALEAAPYDAILDLEGASARFKIDFSVFRARVQECEQRLAQLLASAFDDCVTLHAKFRLLESFDSLLERPLLAAEVERRHAGIVAAFSADMKKVQELFLNERDAPPIGLNLPPVAGALHWARGLRERVHEPMARVRSLGRGVLAREETKDAMSAYSTFTSALDEYERGLIASWGQDVERSSSTKLQQPLLVFSAASVRTEGVLRILQPPATLGGGAGGAKRGLGEGSGGGGGAADSDDDGEEGGAAQQQLSQRQHGGLLASSTAGGAVVVTSRGTGTPRSSRGSSGSSSSALSMRLSVNFEPGLVRLLREVKYFLLLGLDVPRAALDVYRKGETFRRQVGALDIVADCHNDMAREMLPVEEPLLAGTLSKMASLLKRGASELTWKSPASAVDGFVGECSTLVRGAHEQLFALKGHLRDIANDLESWSREPLFTRKPKPMSVDEFEAVFRGVRTARYAAITEGGKVIDKKLREAAVLMRVPRSSPIWAGYVDFVQGVVIQGLTQLVAVSLRRLNEVLSHDHGAALLLGSDGSGSGSGAPGGVAGALSGSSSGKHAGGAGATTSASASGGAASSSSSSSGSTSSSGSGGALVPGTGVDSTPLLIVELVLSGGRVRFVPEVVEAGTCIEDLPALGTGAVLGLDTATSSSGGLTLYDIVGSWVDSFYHAAAVFPRLDDSSEGRYVREVADDPLVSSLLASLSDNLARCEASCDDFRARYAKYAYLWNRDQKATFAAFCAGAYVPLPKSEDQLKAEADMEAEDIPPQPVVPDLAAFDAEITKYRELAELIGSLRTPTDIGFLRVNSSPIKFNLSSLASSWAALFVNHLVEYVSGAVADLHGFIATVETGLSENVGDGCSKAALQRCMTHIRDVRKCRYVKKAAIIPLRKAVALLKKHGVSVDALKATVVVPHSSAASASSASTPHSAGAISGGHPSGANASGVHHTAVSSGDSATGGSPGSSSSSGAPVLVSIVDYLETADLKVESCISATFAKKEAIFPLQTAEMEAVKARSVAFEDRVRVFWNTFRKGAPFAYTGPVEEAYGQLDVFYTQLTEIEDATAALHDTEELFELPSTKIPEIAAVRGQLRTLKVLWDYRGLVGATYDAWKTALWAAINTEALEDANKKIAVELKRLGDASVIVKGWTAYRDLDSAIRDMATSLPLVNELHSPAMRPRHWKELAVVCGVKNLDPADPKFCLEDLLDLKLHTHADAVSEIVDGANKEQKIERKMDEIEGVWRGACLDYLPHKDSDVRVVRASDELLENLDAHQMELQSIMAMGRVMEFFRTRVEVSQRNLGIVEEVLREWLSVTKAWASLEAIFLGSADIRSQLPDDTKRFEGIDGAFKELMKAAVETPNAVDACTKEGRGEMLHEMTKNLELCQKSLNEYLDTKKKIFPRFYFVSNVALLDILSNGNNPPRIMPYVGDCYDSISDVVFDPPAAEGGIRNTATKMIAKDGEIVDFHKPFVMSGAVERWLNELTVMQQDSLRVILEAAVEAAVNWDVPPVDKEKPRHTWLEDYPAQVALVASQIYWTEETQAALDELEAGTEDSVKRYLGVCNDRLNALIARVLGDLKPDLRTKIIALITLDVHARDVVQKLIDSKAEGPGSFIWSQQLRFYWAAEKRDVNIAITDFRSKYSYEYLGNSGRLVITPLTDRCYITLTMALRLMLGGAPAGPAGTGKTETTKDLARALALPCYVFNCSDQMNYQTMADIFKGLAQTGAWGCFDEFNRINIEVLSVIATQVKSILDACVLFSNPANRPDEYAGAPPGSPPVVVGQFELAGDLINLIPTVGMFITMNPGYAGRTELPENLKALFRSCAMIRPDLALICENMLMSEGFRAARPLSIKFVTLYQLSSELLSPQAHYDWGLRAVKTVLRVAGALKRSDPTIDEEGILMRALRDFNTPKMPNADVPIFLRLIQDLFPRYYSLPTKFSVDLQKATIAACRESRPVLQHDPGFVAKVVQLQELLDVRHSVMLVGPAGCGKTTVWKTLAAAQNLGKPKNKAACVYDIVDPKAVTSNELYGYMTLAKEWKDGVLSIIMRGMSKNVKELGYHAHQTAKWVVLDGDIDAVWIESMNTVMDDNKMLTLVSNERIPLSPAMRMVFEVNSLSNATPATVSRAGILFINETDIGWRPFVETWITGLEIEALRAHLPGLFDRYVEAVAEGVRKLKTSTPLPLINQVMSLCRLMEGFIEHIPRDLLAAPAPPSSSSSSTAGVGGANSSGNAAAVAAGAAAAAPGLAVTTTAAGTPRKPLVELLEYMFFVSTMWSFGGALAAEAGDEGPRSHGRLSFHSLMTSIGAGVKFPKADAAAAAAASANAASSSSGHGGAAAASSSSTAAATAAAAAAAAAQHEGALCFDYFFNPETEEMEHWSSRVHPYSPVPIGSGPGASAFSSLVVPTVDSTRLTALLDALCRRGHPVMFVGAAGTGKTTLVKSYLASRAASDDTFLSTTVTLNYYLDSTALQARIDGAVDKRSGRTFGPPQGKKLVFYLDDLNLPYVETYGTQNALSLLRQVIDHRMYYDRSDLGARKEVTDLGFIASMNPTAGSFAITERLQRCFTTFTAAMPSDSDLGLIYRTLLTGHLSAGFTPEVRGLCDALVDASLKLHKAVAVEFLPDAERFTYNWSMRELANVFQGLTSARGEYYPTALKFSRLWLHEVHRVYGDRLVDAVDTGKFDTRLRAVCKTYLGGLDGEALFAGPLVHTSFAAQPVGLSEGTYLPLPPGEAGMAVLSKCLADKLEEFNAAHSIMDLVLFEEAMEHVARIARIIANPAGNAMLIGVGGSGKQSLTRLAAFICGYEVRQLAVTSRFTVGDLRDALKEMYRTAGVKGAGLVFLLTDSQIVNDRFLVYINDLLSSGWIADLFEREEMDAIIGALRNEAKAAGVLVDSPDEMTKFFIGRVRANLHTVLCFSPVGESFRVRARRFPGLINATVIDRFAAWPKTALVSVASRFISDLELLNDEVKTAVALHMAEVHESVTAVSDDFRDKLRRYNYTTPKSFLELISFYRHLLGEKRAASGKQIARLDEGLAKLRKTAADVAELKVDVQRAMHKAEEEVAHTDVLVAQMSAQRAEAEVEKEAAAKVAARAQAASDAAAIVEGEAERELSEAKPALERAHAAVAGLDKGSLTELKNFKQPPRGVEKVTATCCMMLEGETNPKKAEAWDRGKKMMADVGSFLQSLEKFDAKSMSDDLIARLEPYIADPTFNEVDMKSKSAAAANLCSFVVNIYTYNRIYVKVKPLMDSLEKAQGERAVATGESNAAMERVSKLEAALAKLQSTLEEATAKRTAAEAEAAHCSERLALANRLVHGLASENERWGAEVAALHTREKKLIGDTLLAAGFVSYAGAFNAAYRRALWESTWIPDIKARGIPVSEGTDPLDMLTNEGHTAAMLSQGLPADRISIENGALICSAKRWPLIIDPQQQGVKWLRAREAPNKLSVIQLTQPGWLKVLTGAIAAGTPVLIENCGEDIDATLEPVLSRAVFNKGRTLYLRVGGEEVEYDPRFRLYLQTKLTNPHYRPEIQAQCCVVNFIATESGLQDQLLARVVNEEKAELEARKTALAEAFNKYKVQLLGLEDDLLSRLASAPEDILSDVPLIEGLEATKAASLEIAAAVARGKETEKEINAARRVYEPVAEEGAMLYFLVTGLAGIEHSYQYSLDAFVRYFYKAIRETPKAGGGGSNESDLGGGGGGARATEARVLALRDTLRLVVYTWVSRGLFERHKIILLAQLTLALMARGKIGGPGGAVNEDFSYSAFQFLLRGPKKLGAAIPTVLEWLPEPAWNGLQALADLEGGEFAKLPSDMCEAPSRFREWFTHVTPEAEKLPLDWSCLEKTPFKKLLVLRCLRPDRLTVALREFCGGVLPSGRSFVDADATLNSTQVLEDSLRDSTPSTPIYFLLSAGSDVVSDVDRLARKLGYEKGTTYINVSMGQGQDLIANAALDAGMKAGHWVLLNNVHLMPRWLVDLEKRLDAYAAEGGGHERFRVFLTSEPSASIPIGILSRSIKLTNEPPQGLKANLKRAFCVFSPEQVNDMDSKQRSILFGLCHFHAVMIERKKFGPKGFNMMYPFSLGDLRDSAVCLQNYMDNASGGRIPWEDLRYLFGQIIYGGHVVNDFDRLLVSTYLDYFLRDELLDESELIPFAKDEKGPGSTFKTPSPTTYDRYLEHIEVELKGETPLAFGLHPNAEIGFRTEQSENLLRTLLELQPRDGSGGGSGHDDKSPRAISEAAVAEFLDTFGEMSWDTEEVAAAAAASAVGTSGGEDGASSPYLNVLMLELKQMNTLLSEMRRSLVTLRSGFEGKLTMSEGMERLEAELALDRVPSSWAKLAWPSQRGLAAWKHNLTQRCAQLNEWVAAGANEPLKVTWIAGLINPQSFLTAVRQTGAQRMGAELDKLTIATEITKKMSKDEIDAPSRDGAYISGMYMQGARWDAAGGFVERSRSREMYCEMPIVNVRAVNAEKLEAETKGSFACPVYKTEQRGPTFVFMSQLKTKSPPARWILAGVSLLLDVGQ